MKTALVALVGLFSLGLSPIAMAQIDPAPAEPAPAGVAAVVDTADYVQITALPFIYRSFERDRPGALPDSDSSGTFFGSVSPTLYFKAGWDRFAVRALVLPGEGVVSGNFDFVPMARVQGGFRLTDLLELGAYLAGQRVHTEPSDTSSATVSFFYFGPYARIAMGLGALMSLESEIRLGIGLGTVETETVTGGGMTVSSETDRSGFELAVSGALVRNLTSNLDYAGTLEIGYNTFGTETGAGDDERSVMSISIIPLGLRYRF